MGNSSTQVWQLEEEAAVLPKAQLSKVQSKLLGASLKHNLFSFLCFPSNLNPRAQFGACTRGLYVCYLIIEYWFLKISCCILKFEGLITL